MRHNTVCISNALLDYLISIIVSGSFLSALLKYIGTSDAAAGIISSFVSLSCCVQLFSGILLRKGRSVKRMCFAINLADQLLFAFLYTIPFLPLTPMARQVLFAVTILAAYFLLNIMSPVRFQWLMSDVAPDKRGVFTAKKEIISLIGGMIYAIVMSMVADAFRESGRQAQGFLVYGITILVIAVINSYCMSCSKEQIVELDGRKASFGIIRESKALRRLLVINILWSTAYYLTAPYFGTYSIGELGYSLTAISIITVIYSIVRALVSPFCGRYADKKNWISLLRVCMRIMVVAFAAAIFMAPGRRYLYVVYQILFGISFAGASGAFYNSTYDYLDERHFSEAMGARNAIGGIVGFLASLPGSFVVAFVQARGNTLFGTTIYAQQILSFISMLIIIALLFYMRAKCRKGEL